MFESVGEFMFESVGEFMFESVGELMSEPGSVIWLGELPLGSLIWLGVVELGCVPWQREFNGNSRHKRSIVGLSNLSSFSPVVPLD
jgi:hypothetical protein